MASGHDLNKLGRGALDNATNIYQGSRPIDFRQEVFFYIFPIYEGGSICNENPFITPSTNVLGFYAICQMKDQSVAVIMVHRTLFYLPNLISYRLFKKHTNIHCIYFPPNCKDSVEQK